MDKQSIIQYKTLFDAIVSYVDGEDAKDLVSSEIRDVKNSTTEMTIYNLKKADFEYLCSPCE